MGTRNHAIEVASGERFEFGRNWSRYLSTVDEACIQEAEKSLREMLEVESLAGKRFLDIGSGSGLHSLVARRLGAEVYSFDYDPESVACTLQLKQRYFPQDAHWFIREGSVLDPDYLQSLGEFDIVYSWGVLHHTGAMWQALENAGILVAQGGQLFISIYNAQPYLSAFWRKVKRFYCSGFIGSASMIVLFFPYFFFAALVLDLFFLKNPIRRYIDYKKVRGMAVFTDWIDWLGGYPFEVAKPEQIFDFYRKRGFQLKRLKTCGGNLGCNEYVFVKSS